jgi:hypothetical protein
MAGLDFYKEYLIAVLTDDRLTPYHLTLIGVILMLSRESSIDVPVRVTRNKLMRMAHIQSPITYHKCIRQLQAFGYIRYMPSYHPALGSQISLVILNAGTNKKTLR